MRFVVVGAGAVGASVTAELHRGGAETVLVARGAQLAALRERGLRYLRPDGEHLVRVPVAGGVDDVELRDGDVLVLAVKSQDTAAAVREWAWRPVRRADGGSGVAAGELPVVTLQNGLDNERTALRSFAQVVGGMIWIPATFAVPGEVVNHTAGVPAVIFLGRYPDAPGALAERIGTGLRDGGFSVYVVPDVTSYKAAKLLRNMANTLDALYPPSALAAGTLTRLQDEAAAVFAAAGIVPAELDTDELKLADVPGRTRVGTSTRQSLLRGAAPETDYLDGEIVLLGRLHGVPTPAAAAIQARLHRALAEGTEPGSLDDDDLTATLTVPPYGSV